MALWYLPILIHLWVRASAHSSQERFIWNETIIVLRVAAFLNQNINFFTLQLLTERQKDVFELSQHHGAILHLVNQLQSWVEIQTTEAVTKIKHIHPRLALKVIDVEGKFCTFYVLCIKISHFELFVPLCSLTTIEGEDRTEVPM